jgi:hypothetical protein
MDYGHRIKIIIPYYLITLLILINGGIPSFLLSTYFCYINQKKRRINYLFVILTKKKRRGGASWPWLGYNNNHNHNNHST